MRKIKCIFCSIFIIMIGLIVINGFCISVDIYKNEDMNGIFSGDVVVSNRLGFKLKGLKRGDAVCFMYNDGTGREFFIRRIVGMPGENIGVENDRIWVNGQECIEDYTMGNMSNGIETTLDDESYLTVTDDRSSEYEPAEIIQKKNVIGTVFKVFHTPDFLKESALWNHPLLQSE